VSSEEPRTSSERPKGEERAVSDPSTIELDALDRLIRGGRPPHPPVGALAGALASGSEMESLAQVAFAVRDTAADETGLHVDRTWARISAGIQAPAPLPTGPLSRLRAAVMTPFAAPGPRRRLAFTPWSRAASSFAAVLVLAIVAALSVLVLPGGSAEASFLDAVQELTATSDTALADASISADEATTLQRRVDAVVAALASNPEALTNIAPDQTRAALRAINRVRVALDSASPAGAAASAVTTAAVLAASLAQLDAVAATVAAVVGQGESSRPAIDRSGDAPAGNDTTTPDGSGPARPGAVVDDEAADPADSRDDPTTGTRPSEPTTDQPTADGDDRSGELDRPAAVDGVRESETDLADPATDADRTDPIRVPLNPAPPNDTATDSAPVESPPTDVAGVDSERDPDSTADGDSRDTVTGDSDVERGESEVETDDGDSVAPDDAGAGDQRRPPPPSREPHPPDPTRPAPEPAPPQEEPTDPPRDTVDPDREIEGSAITEGADTTAPAEHTTSEDGEPQDGSLGTSAESVELASPDPEPETGPSEPSNETPSSSPETSTSAPQPTPDSAGPVETDNNVSALGDPAR